MNNYQNPTKRNMGRRVLTSTGTALLTAPALAAGLWSSYDYSILKNAPFRMRAKTLGRSIKGIFERSALNPAREVDFEAAAFLAVVKASPSWLMQSRAQKDKVTEALTTPPPDYRALNLVTTYGIEEEFFGLTNRQLRFLDNALLRSLPDWLLTHDASIKPTDDTKGRELVTPILDTSNIQHLHSVTTLIQGLGGVAELPCALHIHAGIRNSFDKARQLPIARQVVLNYMALENQLLGLSSDLVASYNLSDDIFPKFDKWLYYFLQNDEKQFVNHTNVHGRRKSKVNAESYWTPYGEAYGTLEFREHPGSVAPMEIYLWLKFVNGIVALAESMTREGNAHIPNETEMNALFDLAHEYRSARGFTHPECNENYLAVLQSQSAPFDPNAPEEPKKREVYDVRDTAHWHALTELAERNRATMDDLAHFDEDGRRSSSDRASGGMRLRL